ncbi:MAG TPA: thioredoxin [Ktedonobacterales bacterium]|jgi:thioredoxin 1
MSGSYIEVTDQSFRNDVIGAEAPVIVDFWAPWCGPCLMMAPTFEALADEYKGKVTFAKMNTDDNMETPGRLGIQGIPTMILFKGGKEVDRIVGLVRRDVFQKRLEAVFGPATA